MAEPPSASRPATLRFGLFEAGLIAGELRRRGRKVALQDQPFQVLAALLRRPCQIVTREELQQAPWLADTFVEFEHGINTAMQKLRQALGDSADHPQFIETLPRRGYRFIATVSETEATAEAPAAASAPPGAVTEPVRAAATRRWWRIAMAGVGVAAVEELDADTGGLDAGWVLDGRGRGRNGAGHTAHANEAGLSELGVDSGMGARHVDRGADG